MIYPPRLYFSTTLLVVVGSGKTELLTVMIRTGLIEGLCEILSESRDVETLV